MRQLWALGLVIVAGAASGGAGMQNAEPIAIPFADSAMVIDAEAGDWLGFARHAITRTIDGQERGSNDDLAVTAAFAFDEQFFYALVEARDDAFEFPDRSWRYGDGFYLTFAQPTRGFESNRFVTIGLSREGRGLAKQIVGRDGK
ncbi:MAG: hypothetical protein JSU68_04215, partial [Phycisphaerales bacterium]